MCHEFKSETIGRVESDTDCSSENISMTSSPYTGDRARMVITSEVCLFEQRLRHLARILTLADFLRLRARYEDIFDLILFEGID